MRSAFGLVVALLILYVLNSVFLALLAFTFLCFIPFQKDVLERTFNGAIFGILMVIILLFAFGFGAITDIGLGLSLGTQLQPIQYFLIFLLVTGIMYRALFFAASSVSYFNWATALRRSMRGVRSSGFSTFLIILIVACLILLIGPPLFWPFTATSLQPWLWNSSAIIFTGIWLISFLGGVFSDVQSRQIMGVVMILLSFVIFTLGIGSNIVGEAAFGQWWPLVKDFGDSTIGPVISSIGNFMDSMKEGWRLISCPSCVVQDIIEGRFGKDPQTGLAGALGVEFIQPPRSTPVFPYSDYSVTMEVKNQGAVDAENVRISMLPGEKLPEVGLINPDKIGLRELGFASPSIEEIGKLSKEESRRIEFEATPLVCEVVNKYKLESKILPLVAKLEYDYNVNSKLDFEVYDSVKWDEEIEKTNRVSVQKKPAELTNSPVKLNLDVGEQPKREGEKVIVSISLSPAKDGIKIENVSKIVLHYPKELQWNEKRGCKGWTSGLDNTIIWAGSFPKSNAVNCHFDVPLLDVPSTTFQFSAEAEYSVSTLRDFNQKIEWRTGCCSERVCSPGLKCSWKPGDTETGRCEAEPGNGGSGNATGFGQSKFCENWNNQGKECQVGWGGCTDINQCVDQTAPGNPVTGTSVPVICRDVPGINNPVCCPNDPSYDTYCGDEFTKELTKTI